MSEEIDTLIGAALSNAEAIDHLIGTPIEPFCESLALSGAFAPEFSCMVKDVEKLSDLIHCAEKSGFVSTYPGGLPQYDPTKKDDQYVWVRMEKVFQGKTITFSAFVQNRVFLDLTFGQGIVYQED